MVRLVQSGLLPPGVLANYSRGYNYIRQYTSVKSLSSGDSGFNSFGDWAQCEPHCPNYCRHRSFIICSNNNNTLNTHTRLYIRTHSIYYIALSYIATNIIKQK